MDLKRASLINGAVCDLALYSMGVVTEPPTFNLRAVSLPEMIEARDLVDRENKNRPPDSNGTKRVNLIADDRLIAATYAALTHLPDSQYLIVANPEGTGGIVCAALTKDAAA